MQCWVAKMRRINSNTRRHSIHYVMLCAFLLYTLLIHGSVRAYVWCMCMLIVLTIYIMDTRNFGAGKKFSSRAHNARYVLWMCCVYGVNYSKRSWVPCEGHTFPHIDYTLSTDFSKQAHSTCADTIDIASIHIQTHKAMDSSNKFCRHTFIRAAAPHPPRRPPSAQGPSSCRALLARILRTTKRRRRALYNIS